MVDKDGRGGSELVGSQDTDDGGREGGRERGLLRHGGTDDYEAEYGAEILRNSNWLSWRTNSAAAAAAASQAQLAPC